MTTPATALGEQRQGRGEPSFAARARHWLAWWLLVAAMAIMPKTRQRAELLALLAGYIRAVQASRPAPTEDRT